ncbi:MULTISPECIES: hypothetical protein [unclassified Streptomyces]|uniref:hypothetical protein n=1 Tax=unclassified Streptomyces TaxID=2593676 RepID=UPI000A865C59|nr:hypothetical protein [Streptomyces sp. CB01883]
MQTTLHFGSSQARSRFFAVVLALSGSLNIDLLATLFQLTAAHQPFAAAVEGGCKAGGGALTLIMVILGFLWYNHRNDRPAVTDRRHDGAEPAGQAGPTPTGQE